MTNYPDFKKESFEYDIAISFAGENRKVAENLAEELRSRGVRVFYDEFYKHELLGKDLARYFQDVYGSRTKFAIVLISKHYPAKDWTNFEFSVIRKEARRRQTEFILPIRLDNTKVLGIYDSIAYLDYNKEGIDRIVDCLMRKLGTITYSDRTPRNQEVLYLSGWKVPLTIWWDQKKKVVRLIDQTLIPNEVRVIECGSWNCIEEAMNTLRIRGASAIGAAGAYGLAVEAQRFEGDKEGFFRKMEEVENIVWVRPTSANLMWAVGRVYETLLENRDEEVEKLKEIALREAIGIVEEDIMTNKMLGKHGLEIFRDYIPKDRDRFRILTHSHAGSLASCGYGTVFGVIRTAFMEGVKLHVYADETRPRFQGARITAWELELEGIPVELKPDSAAGWIMKQEGIDMVMAGADRIAANGDTFSNLGTYSLSILAKEHRIPFYVAAPCSSFDLCIETGREVEIRKNSPFDLTPHQNITGIITEAGIIREPCRGNIRKILNR